MMRNLFIIGLILLLGSSCTKDDRITREVIAQYSKENIVFEPELEVCIVLPEVGCGGCIAGGVYFFQENKKKFARGQYKNKIVFTAIQSKKMLYRMLEVQSLDEDNSVVDWENKFLVDGDNAIYPLILHLKRGKIVKAEYQTPYSKDILGSLLLN